MKERILSILILFSTVCDVINAQQTVKYLPCEINTSSFTYKFEYDNMDRIKKAEYAKILNGDTITQVEVRTFCYSETDEFSELKETYEIKTSDKNPKYQTSKVYDYKKKDSIYVCKIKNINLEKDTSDMYFYLNTNGSIRDQEYYSFASGFAGRTGIRYDTFGKIKNISQTDTGMGITLSSQIDLTSDNTNRGIFRDVNFTPITKAAQLNNVFLIFSDQNPIELISQTDYKNLDSENNKSTEHSTIEYEYNTQNYPTEITIKNINKDLPTIFHIKYFELKTKK